MKKAYSHFAALAFAALAFSSCSRANYTTNSTATPLTEASVAQTPIASPAADMSAQVVAAAPAETLASAVPQPIAAAPKVASAPRRMAAPAPTTEVAALTAAQVNQAVTTPTKPTLVQRLLLTKVTKQLAKVGAHQQNAASVEHTAAHSGSLTILLVGLVALLVGIIAGWGWLVTIGAIVAAVGLILLLLKAL